MTPQSENSYIVELFFEEVPHLKTSEFLRELATHCGEISASTENSDIENGGLALTFKSHVSSSEGTEFPSQAGIFIVDKPPQIDQLMEVIEQNWENPDVVADLSRVKAKAVIGDVLAHLLPYKTRLELIHQMVLAILKQCSPIAIHWTPSGCILPPQKYLASKQGQDDSDPVFPAVKLRVFNNSNAPEGAVIMDTLGAASLGLPDVQCHFRDLDPDRIGNCLYDIAYYLFDNGDVIQDNQTVQGISDADKWKCRHEDSLTTPERLVLDIDPGPPYNCR